MPIVVRWYLIMSSSRMERSSCPATSTLPFDADSSPAIVYNSVDLPLPDCPKKTMYSPGKISISMLCTATTSLSSPGLYTTLTSCSLMIGSCCILTSKEAEGLAEAVEDQINDGRAWLRSKHRIRFGLDGIAGGVT